MVATHMPTPCGPMPIRPSVRKTMAGMSDREIANRAFEGPFIDPEYFAELLHRGLASPGMQREDIYRRIEAKENNSHKVTGQ